MFRTKHTILAHFWQAERPTLSCHWANQNSRIALRYVQTVLVTHIQKNWPVDTTRWARSACQLKLMDMLVASLHTDFRHVHVIMFMRHTRWWESKFSAYYNGIIVRPALITHCSPSIIPAHLHSSTLHILSSITRTSHQSNITILTHESWMNVTLYTKVISSQPSPLMSCKHVSYNLPSYIKFMQSVNACESNRHPESYNSRRHSTVASSMWRQFWFGSCSQESSVTSEPEQCTLSIWMGPVPGRKSSTALEPVLEQSMCIIKRIYSVERAVRPNIDV